MFMLSIIKRNFFAYTFEFMCKLLDANVKISSRLNRIIAVTENHTQDEVELDPMEENLCKEIKQEKVT